MQSKKINELGTSLSPSVSDLTVVGDAITGQLKKITLSQIAALFGSSGSVSSIATTAPLTGGTITTSGTLGITQATTSANGYLSSTDWNTFNGKQPALSGTGFIKISGTTVSYDNSSYYLASNPSSFIILSSLSGSTGISYNSSTGVITSTITQYTDALARASLSFASGNASYNNTTGVISIPTNNTQLTNGSNYIILSSLSAGTGISYSNTTGVISSTITQYTDTLARMSLSFTAGSGAYNNGTGVITIPTNNNQITNGAGYITSSALSSYLPLSGGTLTGALSGTTATLSGTISSSSTSRAFSTETATNVLFSNIGGAFDIIFGDGAARYYSLSTPTGAATGSIKNYTSGTNIITWTSGGNVGIGKTTPDAKLQVVGDIYVGNYHDSSKLCIGADPNDYLQYNSGLDGILMASYGATAFYTGASSTERMRITNGGNVLIGTTTDAGYKFQVNGDIYATGSAVYLGGVTYGSTQTFNGLVYLNSTTYVAVGQGITWKGSSGTTYDFSISNSGTVPYILSSVEIDLNAPIGMRYGNGYSFKGNGSSAYNVNLFNSGISNDQLTMLGGLRMDTTTAPLVPPKLTTTQRNALSARGVTYCPSGSMIYNTTTNSMNYWDGSSWVIF